MGAHTVDILNSSLHYNTNMIANSCDTLFLLQMQVIRPRLLFKLGVLACGSLQVNASSLIDRSVGMQLSISVERDVTQYLAIASVTSQLGVLALMSRSYLHTSGGAPACGQTL